MDKIELTGIKRIFSLGDVHLGVRNNSIEWFNIQNGYLTGRFLEQVDEAGFDPETDILIQYGDWNHNRESTNNRIWHGSLSILEKLCKKFKKGVYIFLGNHDVYYKDNNNIHSLLGLSKIFPNLHIIVDPTMMKVNSHHILILPWNDNTEELSKTIIDNSDRADYIMCHADIQSMKLNKYQKIEHGVSLSAIRKYKKVYSGHIHIRQEYKNVMYIGTPYEMDRGDRGNDKGFYVMDTTEKDIKETFVKNDVSPRHIKENVDDLLELTPSEIRKIFSNNFVDVMIDRDMASTFPITRFTEMSEEFNHRRLEFFTYTKEAKENEKLADDVTISKEYDLHEALNEVLSTRKYPARLEKSMREYFNDVRNRVKNNEI